MIHIKPFFKKAQLALAVVVVMTASHAQTVSVPAGCMVVVAGTGGVLGTSPTGKVGIGGIVAMPDPEGGGTFTFNPPAGVTTASWTLKGDLSNSTTTPYYNTPTQPADGLTANIITYNKKYRPTSTEQTNPSYARSKGRVEIFYSLSGCDSFITFDVFKTFTASPLTNVPIIVGPTCLKPNTQYTYSVDQIVSDNANDAIGFDSYYWSGIPESIILSPGFYVSADTSSITFTTGNVVTPITLQCCYGRLNPNTADGGFSTVDFSPGSHLSCVTKSLVVAPLAPEFIATTLTTLATLNGSFAPAACLPTGQNTFTITYPNPDPLLGFTYTWTAPNTGWTLSTSTASGNTTLTVTTTNVHNGNNNPGLLTLTISGSCEDTLFNYQINRNFAAPLAITPANLCIADTSISTLTVEPNASSNSVEWSTIPESIPGIELSNSNSPSVRITATGATAGPFTLQVKSVEGACNSLIATTMLVRPNAPAFTTPTTTIVGSSPTCVPRIAGNAVTFTSTPIDVRAPGVISYLWGIPAGWALAPGSVNPTSTPSISLISGITAPAVVSVASRVTTGTTLHTCQNNAVNFIINYPPVAPAINPITCWNTAAVMPTKTLTINNFQNYGTYSVLPNPALFTTASVNPANGFININGALFLNEGSYALTVRHASGSCTNADTVLTFTIDAATSTVSFTGATSTEDNYSCVLGSGETFSSWQVNNAPVTLSATAGGSGTQLTLSGTSRVTSVSAIVLSGGCLKRVYSATRGTRGAARLANTKKTINTVTIYPNPNDGNFTIQAGTIKEIATATLIDMTGKKLATYKLTKGENKIKNKTLPSGIYSMVLEIDGETDVRQIIIN